MTTITIYYIVFSQALFTTIILYNLKNKSSSTNLLVALIAWASLHILFNILRYSYPDSFSRFMPLEPFVFAIGPLMLLYLRATLRKIPVTSTVNILHFIPYIFFFSLSLLYQDKPFVFRIQGFKNTNISVAMLIIYCVFSYISIFIYSILCWTNINKAKKNIEDFYSYEKSKKLIYWFRLLTITMFIMYTIPTLLGIMSVISQNDTFDTSIIITIGYGLICYMTVYFMIKSPEVFTGDETENPWELSTSAKKVSYGKSQLPKEMLDKYIEKLKALMDNDKIYLDPDLSLDEVAKKIGVPRHHITQALRVVLNKNFYLFLNEYRINEFKKRAIDPKYDKNTIISLAFDSGFSSKSSFNDIFKKFTGQTPTEYVEQAKMKAKSQI